MRAAVMQPYLFPYIGYFQLMAAVDVFVCYDDVQYIRRGWINRNRISYCGYPKWITMPVIKSAVRTPINQCYYASDTSAARKIVAQVDAAYRDFHWHRDTMDLLVQILSGNDRNIARFNTRALRILKETLGIECEMLQSSQIVGHQALSGGDRIVELCRRLGADHYVNPIGGMELYDHSSFREAGVELSFIRCDAPPEKLQTEQCHLSILDSLMRHGATGCRQMLERFSLLQAEQALTSA